MVTLHLPIDAPDFYPNKPATRHCPTRLRGASGQLASLPRPRIATKTTEFGRGVFRILRHGWQADSLRLLSPLLHLLFPASLVVAQGLLPRQKEGARLGTYNSTPTKAVRKLVRGWRLPAN